MSDGWTGEGNSRCGCPIHQRARAAGLAWYGNTNGHGTWLDVFWGTRVVVAPKPAPSNQEGEK